MKSLKELRENKGLSVEEVASATKLSSNLIIALEENNVEVFPAKIYLRGALLKYLTFLGLRREEIISLESQYLLFWDKKKPPLEKKKEKVSFWRKNILLNLILVFIIGAGVGFFFNFMKKREKEWKEQEEIFQRIIIPPKSKIKVKKEKIISSGIRGKKDVGRNSESDEIKEDVIEKTNVSLNIKEKLKLEVTIDGEQHQELLVTEGSELNFKIKESLLLKVPSLEALEIKLDGKPFSLPTISTPTVPYQILIKKDQITLFPEGTPVHSTTQ